MMPNETTRNKDTEKEDNRPEVNSFSYKLSLRDYIRIVFVRKWVVLFTLLIFVGASIYYIKIAPPIYEAEVLLLHGNSSERNPATIISLQVAPYVWDKSQELLLKNSSSGAEIQEQLQNEYNLKLGIEAIVKNISLTACKENSTILQLTANSNTPKAAQALANTAAEIYITKITQLKKNELSQGIVFLEEQLRSVEKKMQQAEPALNDSRDRGNLTFTSGEIILGGLLEKLGDLQIEQLQVEEEIELTKSQLKSAHELISEKKKYAQSSPIKALSPQIDQLNARLIELKLRLNANLRTLTEKAPEVIAIKQKIEVMQKQLKDEFNRLLASLNVESLEAISEWQGLRQQQIQLSIKLRGLERKAKLVAEKIDRFKGEHPELIDQPIELTRLARQSRVHEQTYMLLMDKYEDMRLLEQMKTSQLRVINQAPLPEAPISPKKKPALAIGFVFGLSLGVMLAFFLEYLDDSIKRKVEIEKFFGLPVMGIIPQIKSFDVPEEILDWRRQSKVRGLKSEALSEDDLPYSALCDSQNFYSQKRLPTTAYTLKDANSSAPHKTKFLQPEIDVSRQSKHRRGYRKRMQRLLGHSLLYADPKNPVIENYRNLAANIRYSNSDNPIKSILMTSSVPGEGKTITASNLAIIMAQSGKKVLLIDADLRRPKVHHIFQINREPGLADLLVDEGDFVEETDNSLNMWTTIPDHQYRQNDNSPSEMERHLNDIKELYIGEEWDSSVTPAFNGFIRSTKMENLFLLPSGVHLSNPGMLFTSEKIHHLIKHLSEHFDLVIFDSPPLLSTADAVALSTEVNATLMVISSGKTKRKMGIQSKEILENVNANVMGTVLNKVDYAKQYGSRYYYYYYYSSDNEEDDNLTDVV